MEPPAATVATLEPGLPDCSNSLVVFMDKPVRRQAYLVAGNVAAGVGVRSDEAIVAVLSAPGDNVAGARVGHGAGEALVLGAVNIDADDTAVSVGGGGERAQKGGFLHERHID